MDDRFAHVFKDPRFQQVPVKERKVKIDKRFKGMFNDKRFSLRYTVDKRGRPINSSTSENLRKYYKLSDDDEDEEEEEKEMGGSEFSSEDKKKKEGEGEKRKERLKEKKETKKKNRKVEKEEKKLVSNDVSCNNTDEGIILDSKNSANDSLIKNKKSKTSEKTEIDKKTNLQRKRKLPSEDTVLKSKKKVKKKSRKVIEEIIEADENAKKEQEKDVSENEESGYSESDLGSGPDLARGIGNETSSSDDSESDSQSDDETVPSTSEEIVHNWGEFDKDVPLTSELSRRLAVCNMDWDNITATDLFVVFNSFKPPEGTVLSVKIYLSEFGKQRLEEEVAKGPAELAEIALDDHCSEDDETSDQENEEGNSFHNEKLREYQLNRMKYYYAVIECDTIGAANHVYSQLDGAEYESSKTCFDLRFIPDDMEFDEEVKDICTELPSKDLYEPNQFLNLALSEAEVALTWDETDKKRLETTTRNYNKKNEIKLEDFKDYLALSSEEEEEDGDKEGSDATLISNSDNELNDEDDASSEDGGKSHINKYKKLLEGIEETARKKEEKQIEVTWDIGLKERTEKVLKIKEKKKNSSPWNEFLDKLKEKQKKRKALKKSAEKKDEKQTFSDDEIPSDIDFNDPYFSNELLPALKKKSKTQKKKEKKANHLKKLQGETELYSGLTPEETEQKKQEMAELALLMADEDDMNPKCHFDYEKIIKKESKMKPKKKVKAEKLKDKDDFKLDLNDDRFSAVYTSSLFNIDKSAPEYKKSDAMEALIEEKLRRRYTVKECPENDQKFKENSKPGTAPTRSLVDGLVPSQPSASIDESVNSLVHSVKAKTKSFNLKPNRKSNIWKKLPRNL